MRWTLGDCATPASVRQDYDEALTPISPCYCTRAARREEEEEEGNQSRAMNEVDAGGGGGEGEGGGGGGRGRLTGVEVQYFHPAHSMEVQQQ